MLSLGRPEIVKLVARHTQNYDSLQINGCQDAEPLRHSNCCYEVPIAEDMRLREGERRCSGGEGTLYIRCLLVYLPTEEQLAYRKYK